MGHVNKSFLVDMIQSPYARAAPAMRRGVITQLNNIFYHKNE
jgi:hypothetical protein